MRPNAGQGELVSEVARLFQSLDKVSYYEVLDLDRRCDYLVVRDAFYTRAQRFHPDRFVALDGVAVKQAVYAVYKRMTEAYNVLSDPELRVRYDRGLAQGEVRLSAIERSRRLDADEKQLSNAFARIYLRSARVRLGRGEVEAAWIDVELGLSLEEAQPLLELRQQVLRRIARPSG
jgi:DnaJ-class molecular chaperone